MIIVSNTGPIIALAKVRQLVLLNRLAAAVYIPPRVQAELLAKTGPEGPLLAVALRDAIKVQTPVALDPASESVLQRLDEGERQAIALARGFPPPVLLVMDDRAGRAAARTLGQPFAGLAGLLMLAKRQGLIGSVVPILEAVRAKGYWIADEIIDVTRKLAGE